MFCVSLQKSTQIALRDSVKEVVKHRLSKDGKAEERKAKRGARKEQAASAKQRVDKPRKRVSFGAQ